VKFIFVRHGIAVDKKNGQSDLDDAVRELTREGIKETKIVVKTLKPLFKDIDVIYSSPMVRAVETAQIISKYFPKKKFELMPSLDPSIASEAFLADLSLINIEGSYCFVGHEPHLTTTISKLLKEQTSTIELDKSGIIVLEGKNLNHLKISLIISPALLEMINS
jgi:phosphohistidine phosphatase